MPKKKTTRKKAGNELEMIHFRPGAELGSMIGQLSDELAISRGETAKRLTALAIRGLDVGFYGAAAELTDHLYASASFDEACHHLHVAVQEVAEQSGQEIVDVPREKKLEAVEVLLDRYRMMRSFEEEVQQKRVSIKLYRTCD